MMKIQEIDDDLLDELFESKESAPKYPVPSQLGPLRHFDTAGRCACRGCGSSTFYKVCGVRRCMTHALHELNQMLVERGVDG